MRHTIDGKSAVCGIIGWPVEHSLSPAMHNAAFEAAGLNWVYVPWAVRPDDLLQALDGLRALGVKGFNVTVPHKERVAELVDCRVDDAELIGAVNTVTVSEGKLTGYNTDGIGFIKALAHSFAGKRLRTGVLLGCGGAARAVLLGLVKSGVKTINCFDISVERAEKLVSAPWAERLARECGITIRILMRSELEKVVRSADLIVNATPVGMKHGDSSIVPTAWLHPKQAVVDLVYRGGDTPLVHAARQQHATAVNGLGMLREQAASAFEIWTGRQAPRDVMNRVLEEANCGKTG